MATTPIALMETLTTTLRDSLRLRSAAIWLVDGGDVRVAASSGSVAPLASATDLLRTHLAAPSAGLEAGPGFEALVPVRHQGELVGVIGLGGRGEGDRLSPRDIRLAERPSSHAGPLLRAVVLEERLKASYRALAEAQDRERGRLHRDLHDGLGPTLAGIRFHAQAALDRIDRGAGWRDEVEAVDAAARAATEDVRRIVHGLAPPGLAAGGLAFAVTQYATEVERASGLRIDCDLDASVGTLSRDVALCAFRIGQEAVPTPSAGVSAMPTSPPPCRSARRPWRTTSRPS